MRPRSGAVTDAVTLSRPSRLLPIVVSVAFFMEALDSTIIATAIPQIAKSVDASPLHLSFAITSYLLSLAIFMPISGWIADRFGARNVFCGAIAMFTAGSALCGMSTTLSMLVATRVLQGFGGSMMTPVGRLIMLRSYRKDELVAAMSTMAIEQTAREISFEFTSSKGHFVPPLS
jgi:MFS family permease